jgi:hypothetical protein
MAHTEELLRNPQQIVANPWRGGWRYPFRHLASVFILAGLCGLMLTGCQVFWRATGDLLRIGGEDAEAQANRDTERVETFVIDPSSFRIRVENDIDPTPGSEVKDGGAIVFTMESGGTVLFTSPGTGDRSEPVESGDTIVLVLNGTTSTVTFIRGLSAS